MKCKEEDEELEKLPSSGNPDKMAKMKAILSQFIEEQMKRYESLHRVGFQKSNMKRILSRKSFMLSTPEEKEDFWWSFNLAEILPNFLSLLEVQEKRYSVPRRDFVSAKFVEQPDP
ncbi:uncharacterized protein LOC130961810 [Arachis stenosperma]|uniref:uncharacterized protein LOC130961810 n=1 Tax=Arachis stenosperma TaxID=217475 RepID=UPI0025ABC8F1|nr:uncharacterized protein LOC130961810 [Arachis stenosperma]